MITIELNGSSVGCDSVNAIKAVRQFGRISLADAKAKIDQFLAGERVEIRVATQGLGKQLIETLHSCHVSAEVIESLVRVA